MITRKSKIKYELVVNEEENDRIKQKIEAWFYMMNAIVSYIIYIPDKQKFIFMFTKKQYELFKKVVYETKNKK